MENEYTGSTEGIITGQLTGTITGTYTADVSGSVITNSTNELKVYTEQGEPIYLLLTVVI